MNAAPDPLAEYQGLDAASFKAEVVPRYRPAVLRGVVSDWPAVQAAQRSSEAAVAYLTALDSGAAAEAFLGPPEIEGRFFYRADMSGFNFERRTAPFAEVLRYLLCLEGVERPPSVYVGAAALPDTLPGFAEQNPLELLAAEAAVPRIWLGNRSVVATHFDLSDNIACVVGGRRRITLFPPDQLPNLYVGPLDFTMAGQPASMVSTRDPDFDEYPRFREAMAAAHVVEIEPGDAIYIPALWWHNIEALSPFNILVNYWWQNEPPEAGSGLEALVHGILTIAHLPPERRTAWRALYDHYVFRPGGADPVAHLAPQHRGILGAPTPQLRRRIRDFLLRGLSRR
jgi:hypothetical protein